MHSMCGCGFLLRLFFLLLLSSASVLQLISAELVRLSPAPSAAGDRIPTSLFKFFGRPGKQQSINASAVVLPGHELCSATDDEVWGKIVVAETNLLNAMRRPVCTLEGIYRLLLLINLAALCTARTHSLTHSLTRSLTLLPIFPPMTPTSSSSHQLST